MNGIFLRPVAGLLIGCLLILTSSSCNSSAQSSSTSLNSGKSPVSKSGATVDSGKTATALRDMKGLTGFGQGDGLWAPRPKPLMFSEFVGQAELIFTGTVSEIGRGRHAVAPHEYHPASRVVHDVTFDVEHYYRNELRAGDQVVLTLYGGSAVLTDVMKRARQIPPGEEVAKVEESEARFTVGEKVLIFAHNNFYQKKRWNGATNNVSRLGLVEGAHGKFEFSQVRRGIMFVGGFAGPDDLGDFNLDQYVTQWPYTGPAKPLPLIKAAEHPLGLRDEATADASD